MPASSLRALLANSIDYAGLFPPAALALEPALKNHADYVRSPDSWMLGAFILPLAQFDALASHLAQFDRQHPLRISALARKSETSAALEGHLQEIRSSLETLVHQHRPVLVATQLEVPLPDDFSGETFARAATVLAPLGVSVFWEAVADEAERAIALLREHNKTSSGKPFGFKLRTGGVTADAFPASEQIAAALVASAQHHVPIKFTAGLHHPVRLYHNSVKTKMHGFLNVLGAGVLANEHHWHEDEVVAMLEDEKPGSFSFEEESFSWRQWDVATDRIKTHRKLVTSYGSCSFDEPRDDLRAIELL